MQNRRLELTGLTTHGETCGLMGTGTCLARQEAVGRVLDCCGTKLIRIRGPNLNRWRSGETVEVENRGPIINTPPHLSRHPTGIRETEQFWLEESRKIMRGYDTTWRLGSTHLCGSTRSLRRSEWDQKMGKIECVIRCIMRWDTRCDASNLMRGLPNIYFLSLHPSPLPLYPHTPPSPSPSQSSLYLHTPGVPQSSANLSVGGGEKRIFPPQLLPGPVWEAHLFSLV